MSRLKFTKVAAPATPSANKSELFVDTNDRRTKQIDDTGVITTFGSVFDKNLVCNGGFDIIQRCAAALTNITGPSTTNRVYSADRWGFTVGNATTPQFQQVDTIAAFETGITARYYGLYKQLTNAAKIALTQVIEGTASAAVRGRVVRVQCKMRILTGSARTVQLGLITNTGTVDAPTAAWISAFGANGVSPTLGASLAFLAPNASPTGDNCTIQADSAQCSLTTSWQRFSVCFTVPTTAKNIMPVVWSTNTFAANDDLLITEAGVYDGPEINDWVPLGPSLELTRCQRYYSKTFAIGTVPAASVLSGAIFWNVGVAGAAAGAWGGWKFPVRMVKAPTITLFNPGAAGAQVRQFSATVGDCTTSSGTSISDTGCQFTTTPGATIVLGGVVGVNAVADAEL